MSPKLISTFPINQMLLLMINENVKNQLHQNKRKKSRRKKKKMREFSPADDVNEINDLIKHIRYSKEAKADTKKKCETSKSSSKTINKK